MNYFHGALNCSLDMLYDINSGDLLAIIHDGYLQKMRVQATNAIAARYMAKKNANSMALIGSGWQATAAIEAMRFVRPIQEVNVFSPMSRIDKNSFSRCARSTGTWTYKTSTAPSRPYTAPIWWLPPPTERFPFAEENGSKKGCI